MVVDVIGVVINTPHRATNVPANPCAVISLARGESATIRMRLVYATGAPVPTSAIKAETFPKFTARSRIAGSPKLLDVSATWVPATSTWDFLLLASKTVNIVAGRYAYDVWITLSNDERAQVIPVSTLVILGTEQV